MQEQPKLSLQVIEAGSLLWHPKDDITAYELALALRLLLLTDEYIKAQMFSELPPDVSRHFRYRTRHI